MRQSVQPSSTARHPRTFICHTQEIVFTSEKARMLTCPECHTTYQSNVPFCENCGYRVRRSDSAKDADSTQVSGLRAQRAVAPGRERQAVQSGLEEDSFQRFTASHVVSDASPEENAASSYGFHSSLRDESASRTLVEGLQPVSPHLEDDSELPGLEETTGPEEKEQQDLPIEMSGIYPIQLPAQHRNKFVVSVLLCSAFAVMLIVLVYMAWDGREDPNEPSVATAREPSHRVPIEAGPFRRGLNEEVRSFILQTCMRIHEEPEDGCVQSTLLKGEYPQRTVELPAFAIDSKEVTTGQYKGCVDAGQCEAVNYRDCSVWTAQGLQVSLRVPKILQESHRPVTCVTREDARSYCAFAGGALPTHDQWEKAARGEEGWLFPWGDVWSSDFANWGEVDIVKTAVLGKLDGFEWTAPPGSFPDGVSPFGVYDMAGNVAEWVDGQDPLVGHVRGGSWISNPFELRTTARVEVSANARRTDVGFRCAYD